MVESSEAARSQAYVVLDIGCAECRGGLIDGPLVEKVVHFSALDEAKEYVSTIVNGTPEWRDHPLGGVFFGFGSGDIWIAPVSVFTDAATK